MDDLRGAVAGAADVMALAREYRNADTVYEVEAYWDLWQRDGASGRFGVARPAARCC